MKRIDIIWNITRICPWDCGVCCVDAIQVKAKDGLVLLRSAGLAVEENITRPSPGEGSIFDRASVHEQQAGRELTLAQKLMILDHLDGFDVKLDFSGGDALVVRENLGVLQEASRRYGQQNITLTVTGAGLAHWSVPEIAPYIGEFNFTFDGLPGADVVLHRPNRYVDGNLKRATAFANSGVATRAECPLTTRNLDPQSLETMYAMMHHAGIRKLLLMRLFPVGRANVLASDIPSVEQYRSTIAVLRRLEAQFGSPVLKLQCALRFLDSTPFENPCDLVRESFGLMADGTLLASPWAVNSVGQPLDNVFVLGNLARSPMSQIMQNASVAAFSQRLDDNFGHCKIFSFLNASDAMPAIDRVFASTDPLYAEDSK